MMNFDSRFQCETYGLSGALSTIARHMPIYQKGLLDKYIKTSKEANYKHYHDKNRKLNTFMKEFGTKEYGLGLMNNDQEPSFYYTYPENLPFVVSLRF